MELYKNEQTIAILIMLWYNVFVRFLFLFFWFFCFDSSLNAWETASFFSKKEAKKRWGNIRRFPQTSLLDSYAEGETLPAPFLWGLGYGGG